MDTRKYKGIYFNVGRQYFVVTPDTDPAQCGKPTALGTPDTDLLLSIAGSTGCGSPSLRNALAYSSPETHPQN